jgi:hypothetical protein
MSKKTFESIICQLREKWGNYDSEILFTKEFKEMSPEKREESLEQITDLYLQAYSEEPQGERFMIHAQREAYTEGNSILYDRGDL